MSEDESFDSFYSKLNEVVIGKFNLREKTKDSKVVRKILHSLPESLHAKVTAIEESKDLDQIEVQELICSLQTYELSLPNQRKSKSLALKTINERVEAHDLSDEDVVEKDVAYLAKIFANFLNSRILGNLVIKGNSQVLERRRRTSKREKGRSPNPLKESLVLNVMDMAISKRNVLTI